MFDCTIVDGALNTNLACWSELCLHPISYEHKHILSDSTLVIAHTYILWLKDMADHLILFLGLWGSRSGLNAVLRGRTRHSPASHQHHDVPDVSNVRDGAQGVVHHRLLQRHEQTKWQSLLFLTHTQFSSLSFYQPLFQQSVVAYCTWRDWLISHSAASCLFWLPFFNSLSWLPEKNKGKLQLFFDMSYYLSGHTDTEANWFSCDLHSLYDI